MNTSDLHAYCLEIATRAKRASADLALRHRRRKSSSGSATVEQAAASSRRRR